MKFWNSFVKKFGTLRTRRTDYEISTAIRRVFLTNPSREDQERVLAHLAARMGWNQVQHPRVASTKEIWFAEGKRAAFAEIFSHLSLSDEDVTALENAARLETAYNLSIDATKEMEI